MPTNKGNVVRLMETLAQPVADELGLTLWDIEFVKEGSAWYLRFYIDRPGGVTLDDCESFHRRIDPLIDEADPIQQSYFLEVSSPGTERALKKPEHFRQIAGSPVRVRLIRPDTDGARELTGVLKGLEQDEIVLECADGERRIKRTATAFIHLLDSDAVE